MKKIIALALLSIILIACDETKVEKQATLITYDEITSDIGYPWFDNFYTEYTPVDSLVEQIKESYKEVDDTFLIFASMTCGCDEEKEFPKYLKVLHEAGIYGTIIYNTQDISYTHPYQDQITLTKLPSVYKLSSSGEIVYSVSDSLYKFIDPLIEPEDTDQENDAIEKAILESLEK